MKIPQLIREYAQEVNHKPGAIYHIGLRITETIPYEDTKNLHDVDSFHWVRYSFNHTGDGLNWDSVQIVPCYDQKGNWFDKKCSDLFKLGFEYSDGTFRLPRTWSCYWEQVARYNEQEWKEYIEAVNEAISDKNKYLIK